MYSFVFVLGLQNVGSFLWLYKQLSIVTSFAHIQDKNGPKASLVDRMHYLIMNLFFRLSDYIIFLLILYFDLNPCSEIRL